MLRVTTLQDLVILIHLTGNFIITLFQLVNVHKSVIFNFQAQPLCACVTSAASAQAFVNLTQLYQKNSSKSVLPAVNQAASSEYVHQLLILLCSVQDIVNVLYLGTGGRTCFSTPLGRIIILFTLYHITF
jgi:hypothetical protein